MIARASGRARRSSVRIVCHAGAASHPLIFFPVTDLTHIRDTIPFIKDLGIEFVESGGGRATIALVLTPRHLNSWQAAHGGVIMTMLDVVMAVAGRSLDPNAAGGVTVEMKTSFLAPGRAGSRLLAHGHAFHRSTTMSFCESEVRDEKGRLLAKAMGTFKYISKRAQPAVDAAAASVAPPPEKPHG
jgi:acyl-CoA thioesterase